MDFAADHIERAPGEQTLCVQVTNQDFVDVTDFGSPALAMRTAARL
jgi:hypothetical protein